MFIKYLRYANIQDLVSICIQEKDYFPLSSQNKTLLKFKYIFLSTEGGISFLLLIFFIKFLNYC